MYLFSGPEINIRCTWVDFQMDVSCEVDVLAGTSTHSHVIVWVLDVLYKCFLLTFV